MSAENQNQTQTLQEFEVVVVGGGPVGLFVTCELALRGVSVVCLERDVELESPWKVEAGLRGINTIGVESFYRRGLLDGLFDPSFGPRSERIVPSATPQRGGHYGGINLDANLFDLATRHPYVLEGPALMPGATSLLRLQNVITARAEALGAKLLRGISVSDVEQNDDSATVHTQSGESFRGKFVVGCDGGRSVVRKSGGFDFVGTEPSFTGYVATFELEEGSSPLGLGWQFTDGGFFINMGREGRMFFAEFDNGAFDRSQTITKEIFEGVVQRTTQTSVRVKSLKFCGTFTDRALQATTYRNKRIILAGDSAHIHGPIGGVGLAVGLADAMNLGWKLAAHVKGLAPAGLLDSYNDERHAAGARVLEYTRGQVAIMKPDPFARAARKLVEQLSKTRDGASFMMDNFWGLALRYDLGSGAGAHALVGRSAPDLQFADGSRLGPKMVSGRGLIVDLTVAHSLKALAEQRLSRIDYIDAPVVQTLGLGAILVRPDGIVAWAIDNKAAPKQLLLKFRLRRN